MQLLVQVEVGRGAFAQRADTVYQRKQELRQHPVEFCERLRDPAAGESRIDAAEPRLGLVGVIGGAGGPRRRLRGVRSGGGRSLFGGSGSDLVWLVVVGCM